MALFAVAGLVFSHGLGRAPLPRVCTQHAMSAPAGAAVIGTAPLTTAPDTTAPDTTASDTTAPTTAAPVPAAAVGAVAAQTGQPEQTPMHACLCLAVLFTLLLLGLALGLRRPLSRLRARHGWALPPPSAALSAFVFPPSFQVLRL